MAKLDLQALLDRLVRQVLLAQRVRTLLSRDPRVRQDQLALLLLLQGLQVQRAQLGRLVQILLLQDLQAQRVQLVLADKTAM